MLKTPKVWRAIASLHGRRCMDLLWLDEHASPPTSLVGGKVAILSRLASGRRVPPGFCLTTVAYTRWANGSVPQSPLPADLRALVSAEYARLSARAGMAEPGVAVRSSAVDEDGVIASFAGQYETYLNIKGADAVADAVVQCWASAQSERLLAYRASHDLSPNGLKLAVLVQQLVYADAAAVIFSANPVTRNRDEVVINASWGLGESIVGGTVTPDTFVVRKPDLRITARVIADKARMTVAAERATREVNVPRLLRTAPALSDEQAMAAVQLALELEAEMDWPVDVEAAFQGGDLYLLQCRPITALIANMVS
jgi:phosphoenolpyruvate synthase/pyruvate phosphate dikinase